MTIKELTLREIRYIYHRRMVDDFPGNELKSLSAIERAIRKGIYRCFGLMDADEILAYAFFVYLPENGEENYLLDYYAVDREHRGAGIGGRFLKMLCENQLKNADCAILEVDDPACAAEDREIRERRLRFYLQNGMADTGERANAFGADFMILRMPVGKTDADFREIYQNIYRAMLPEKLFNAMIRMK